MHTHHTLTCTPTHALTCTPTHRTGGSIVTLVTYIAECSAERLRGPLLIVVQSFQDISIACATFLAWALMGTNGEVSQMSVQLGSLRFTAWRLYLVLCATFVLLVVAPVLCVPESPLFLLHVRWRGFRCNVHVYVVGMGV